MFTRVEVRNYRSLKEIDLQLSDFHVLTGANATGKTTLLDVFGFLSDLMNDGLEAAVEKRTNNFDDLTFGGNGDDIFIGVVAKISQKTNSKKSQFVRYQLRIGKTPDRKAIGILAEALFTHESPTLDDEVRLWENGDWSDQIQEIINFGKTIVLIEKYGETVYFWDEIGDAEHLQLRIGYDKCGLANIPPDDQKWPSGTWLRSLISSSTRTIMLDSYALRQASPFAKKGTFSPDGSRLPWMIEELKSLSPQLYDQWIANVRTALPDLQDVRTVLREDDRHRYLKLVYENGLECPSWTASDGTLRLLALTLIAFIDKFEGIYLIEEPENGIHPLAIETIFSSLTHAFDVQILIATHSPVIVSLVKAKDLLCFSKATNGATNIVSGTDHPRLAEWKGELNLSLLFASGILD